MISAPNAALPLALPARPLQISEGAASFSVTVSPREYVRRGLLTLFLVPVLLFLLLGLLWVLVSGQTDSAVPELPFEVIWLVISAASACVGLWRLASAKRSSAQSTLQFDASRWSVRKQGLELPLNGFACVSARRPSKMLKWSLLELVPHPGGTPLTVYERFEPRHNQELTQYAHWIAARLRLPVQIEPELARGGAYRMDEKSAAMLCYLPLQGIFLAASVYYVLKGDQRPLVRFCARQSLCQTLFSFVTLLAALVVFGVPVALLSDGPARIAAIVLLSVALGAFAIWNLWAHILACSRAYKGKPWVMPWLRPIVRRWLPAT